MLRFWLIGITAMLVVVSESLMYWSTFDPFWCPACWPLFWSPLWPPIWPVFWLLFWPAICAAILLVGLVFERVRYKNELPSPPGPDWVSTGECTVDASGIVRVWYHPGTGNRAYVREQGGGAS